MAAYTLDASVFLNAVRPSEPHHAYSRELLDRLRREGAPLIEPLLLWPEIAAAQARAGVAAPLALRLVDALWRLPALIGVDLDERLARRAAEVAALHVLRGADAVYVAVAASFGSTLATLDREQLTRAKRAVKVARPREILKAR